MKNTKWRFAKHFLQRVHYFYPTPTYMLNMFVNLKDIVHNASVTEGNRDFRGFRGVAMSLIPCVAQPQLNRHS